MKEKILVSVLVAVLFGVVVSAVATIGDTVHSMLLITQ